MEVESHAIGQGAVHKVRHAIYGQFLPPPPVTLCHRSRDSPRSTSHISDPPIFLVGLVQKIRTKIPCTNSLSIGSGIFEQGVFRGSFVWKVLSGVVFVHSSFCHNTSVTRES